MSSFPAQAARVRDPGLPLPRRLLALRECVLRFAPYGFRATWHHLVVSAGLPVYLEVDPDSLIRAVDELEQARALWRAETNAFAARRRREKAEGRRQPRRHEGWHARPGLLAVCPDPEAHPRGPLATEVERLITARRAGADRVPFPATTGESVPWRLIWQRAVPGAKTVGGGDLGEFRVEYTPESADGRFGIFQLYVRGIPIGDATTTALYPHYRDLAELCEAGERGPGKLILGDTFDHVDITLEITEEDLILVVTTFPDRVDAPPWGPRAGETRRLQVRRSEVLAAWREAEPRFRRILRP